jgi:hypothetical protein
VFDGLVTHAPREFLFEGALVSEDIHKFIQERINRSPKLWRWPEDVRAEIESNLLKSADGMYDNLRKAGEICIADMIDIGSYGSLAS